jgi:recombination protein RecA
MAEKGRFEALLSSDLLKKIKKKHGKAILVRADEFSIQNIPRIGTGIFALDYALGGGFPAGRINIVWGNKSTGKTAICLRTLAHAQKVCANCYTADVVDEEGEVHPCVCGEFREHVCAYLDVEGTWDQEWARTMGVDTEKVLLSVPEYAEQTLDIAEALLRSGEVDFLVLDSIAFLTPAKEIEESAGKALQAEQARVLGRGIRKFTAALNYMGNHFGRRPTIMFTNQIRMKIGVMFGSPETQPGGKASGFSATTEVKTYGGSTKAYKMDETTGRPLYTDLAFRVEKNKSSPAKIEGEWRLQLADTETKRKGEIAEEAPMVETGLKIGLVEKVHNQKWTCLGEEYRAKSLIVKKMLEDPEFKATYSEALMTVLTA